MKPFKTLTLLLFVILFSQGCSDEASQNTKGAAASAPGMKCGAGKCGANMFDGNAALRKKKTNILKQMRRDDPRKECVLQARSTKALYDCVRDPKSKKMSLKCGEGKCGEAQMPKSQPAMKCGAGKCGGSM